MSRSRNYIPLPHGSEMASLSLPACVHLSEDCNCTILNVSGCLGEKCTFCQDGNRLKSENEKWAYRMNCLSYEKQRQIADKYFNGQMPWSGEKPRKRRNPKLADNAEGD
ncbi:MAG: hypothetical protein LBT55_01325 [Clostridiaceae bacterium]|nr:hypothetical protein [Clostridiaceae bacterium]